MRKAIKRLAVTSAIVAGLATASALYAHDSEEGGGSERPNGQWRQDAPENGKIPDRNG